MKTSSVSSPFMPTPPLTPNYPKVVQSCLGDWWPRLQYALPESRANETTIKTLAFGLLVELRRISETEPFDSSLALKALTEYRQTTAQNITLIQAISHALASMNSLAQSTPLLELLRRLFSHPPSKETSEEVLLQVVDELSSHEQESALLHIASQQFLNALTSRELKSRFIVFCCRSTARFSNTEKLNLVASLESRPSESPESRCAHLCLNIAADRNYSWAELFEQAPTMAGLRIQNLIGRGDEVDQLWLSEVGSCISFLANPDARPKYFTLAPLCKMLSLYLRHAREEDLSCAICLGSKIFMLLNGCLLKNSNPKGLPIAEATQLLDAIREREIEGLPKAWSDFSKYLLYSTHDPNNAKCAASIIWRSRFTTIASHHNLSSATLLNEITTGLQLCSAAAMGWEDFYKTLSLFFIEDPDVLPELERLCHKMPLESNDLTRSQTTAAVLATTQLLLHAPLDAYSAEAVFEWIAQPWGTITTSSAAETKKALQQCNDLLSLCADYPQHPISASLLPKMLVLHKQWGSKIPCTEIAISYLYELLDATAYGYEAFFPCQLAHFFADHRIIAPEQLNEFHKVSILTNCSHGIENTTPSLEFLSRMPIAERQDLLEKLTSAIDTEEPGDLLVALELLHHSQPYLQELLQGSESETIRSHREKLARKTPCLQGYVNDRSQEPIASLREEEQLGQYLYNLQLARITRTTPSESLKITSLPKAKSALEQMVYTAIQQELIRIEAYSEPSIDRWTDLIKRDNLFREPQQLMVIGSERLRFEIQRERQLTAKEMERWLDLLLSLIEKSTPNLRAEAVWLWLGKIAAELPKRERHEICAFFELLKRCQEAIPPTPVQGHHCVHPLLTAELSPTHKQAIRIGLYRVTRALYITGETTSRF